ncbi:MAG: hypothetical protein JXB20_04770 [Bacilli bacterium]|nr:hypothetical protein [Bacilli bacterium]MBN2696728.1 hypothetical protein [Bacilli bacterium]
MKRPKRLLYQTNKGAYAFMFIFIACLVAYTSFVLKSMQVDHMISAVSLINIVMLLAAFLTAEEIKVYNRKFQFVPLLYAAIMTYQLLNIPTGVAGGDLIIAKISAILAVVSAFAASGLSYFRNRIRAKVIAENNIGKSQLTK